LIDLNILVKSLLDTLIINSITSNYEDTVTGEFVVEGDLYQLTEIDVSDWGVIQDITLTSSSGDITLSINYYYFDDFDVYNEEAPAKATYPIVVYETTTNTEQQDGSEDIVLDIYIDDNKKDTTNIETINQAIYQGLNYQLYTSTAVAASFYCVNRFKLPVPDESLKRRQLKFLVKTFWK